jgi:hypothetical protein
VHIALGATCFSVYVLLKLGLSICEAYGIADRTGGLTNLMRVVYRDGVIFYIVLLCTSVSSAEFWAISYAFYTGFSVVNIFAIIMLPVSVYASIV